MELEPAIPLDPTLLNLTLLDLAPPPEQVFETYEELEAAIQSFAKQHGYAIAIERSHRDQKGQIRARTLSCVKGGKTRDRVVDRKKPMISQKTDCPFRCQAVLRKDIGWSLSVKNGSHNHDAQDPIAFHQHRKLPDEIRLQVAAMSRAGIKPKEIASTVSQTYPDRLWRMQDIYNIRRECKIDLLAGRSPIEAMLFELHNSEYEYNYHLDSEMRVSMILFAHPKSLELLQRYPEVLLMDCTYKTNRFRMPLLDILGSTGLGTTFYAAFVFLPGETEEDYTEALKMLSDVLKKRRIQSPGVIVTDRDKGLMKAIEHTLPATQNILCLWHINKNILAHGQQCRVFKAKTEEEESFLKLWNQLVASPSIELYNLRLSALRMAYQQFPKFLQYIDKTWLTDHKERFVQCWANRYLHFGHRQTSRAEGAHSVIKRYLQVSTGDLHSVLTSLALMLENQHTEHRAAIASARNRTPQCFLVPVLQPLIGHITPYALWRVREQLQILNRPSLHHKCSGTHLNSLGLPCYHVIQDRISQNKVLYLHDFHQRWFFTSPEGPTQLPPPPILNPAIVSTRGRPQGSLNHRPKSSTQRNLSQFELTQNKEEVKRRKRTRTGRARNPGPKSSQKEQPRKRKTQEKRLEPESSTHNSSEDDLMEIELARLMQSGGEAAPLWTEMEEFRGMTRATQVSTRKSQRLVRKDKDI
jgi:hypothetical protein